MWYFLSVGETDQPIPHTKKATIKELLYFQGYWLLPCTTGNHTYNLMQLQDTHTHSVLYGSMSKINSKYACAAAAE